MPSVICIIPTFNEEDRISATVKSALAFCDAVLISDNGSTDETIERASAFENVYIRQHDLPLTAYRERIMLNLQWISDLEVEYEYVTHLNCSESFTENCAIALRILAVEKVDALAVYRRTETSGVGTHPYHLIYWFRGLTRSHKTFRFMRVDQWDSAKCEIHAEWQPKARRHVLSLSGRFPVVIQRRDGDVLLNEKKHLSYARAEAKGKVKQKLPLARSFLRAFAYLLYNVPYLLARPSSQQVIAVVQHCRYFILVGLMATEEKKTSGLDKQK